MPALIQDAQRAARQLHTLLNAVKVRYVTKAGQTYDQLDAVPAMRRTEVMTEGGVSVDRQIRDWIIERNLLPVHPRRGDKIFEIETGMLFQVTHPGGGREWDWHDAYSESYRIHSVEVFGGTPVPPPPDVEVDVTAYGTAAGEAYATATGEAYGPPA